MQVNSRLNLNGSARESNFKFDTKTSVTRRKLAEFLGRCGIAVKFDLEVGRAIAVLASCLPRYSSVDFCFYVSLRLVKTKPPLPLDSPKARLQ